MRGISVNVVDCGFQSLRGFGGCVMPARIVLSYNEALVSIPERVSGGV